MGIEAYLNTPGLRVLPYDTLPSTNTALTELARGGAEEGTVVLADGQTAGRGRMGRSFLSPVGGLYMSLLLRPQDAVTDALRLTAMAAVSAAEAIGSVSGRRVGIKWVNDLLIDGRKVCGILAEGRVKNAALEYAVLGFGVNILPPPGGFPAELEDIAGCVYASGDARSLRDATAAAILDRFLAYYHGERGGWLDEYRARSVLIGREVDVIQNGGSVPARALSIADDLSLNVRLPDGSLRALRSGEVSVRERK